MELQLIAAGLIVVTAVIYLVWQIWRTLGQTKSACGGCGCAKKVAVFAENGQSELIPIEKVRIRMKRPNAPSSTLNT